MEQENFTKETFLNLLSRQGIKKLTIPIIQRSYTQGGRAIGSQNDSDIEKKGERFISRLYDALVNDNPIELDFIYTSQKNQIIYPLDGQQRLTTLFLLYWYIAQKERKLIDSVIKTLQKFTYETRTSSRSFCKELSRFTLEDYYQNSVKETIINQGWFLMSWLHDPSVSSMLGMLEKIDNQLRVEKKKLWDKITQAPDIAPIAFFYTPLESFDLTDDLYIKMNARGKELTGFENTKAEFNKKIDDEGWDKKKKPEETFAHKIDTRWTDLFWKFRNEKNEIDVYILRFMSAVLVNYYVLNNDRDNAQKLYNSPLDISPEFLDNDTYTYLYNCFELFCRSEIYNINTEQFNIVFWLRNQAKIFKNLYQFFELFISKISETDKELFTWQERVVFYGLCLYLQQNNIVNIARLTDWLIFIRNLVSNGTVDSYETFRSAQNRLVELKDRTTDIYTWFSGQSGGITKGFSERQMSEELQKAKIYQNTPEAKDILQKLENRNFCRGRLDFIFYCLDITDNVSDIERLEKFRKVIFVNLKNDTLSDEFKRAMFTITDFWFYRSYCYSVNENKYCIVSDIDELKKRYAFHSVSQQYLKTFLLKLLGSSLENIITSFKMFDDMPNWKWRLITEPDLLDACRSNHITIADNNKHCYLLQAQRPSRDYQRILVE